MEFNRVLFRSDGDASGRPRARIARRFHNPVRLSAARNRAAVHALPSKVRIPPMIGALAKAVFGSANDRYVKSLDKIVGPINALAPQLEAFSDAELPAQRSQERRLGKRCF